MGVVNTPKELKNTKYSNVVVDAIMAVVINNVIVGIFINIIFDVHQGSMLNITNLGQPLLREKYVTWKRKPFARTSINKTYSAGCPSSVTQSHSCSTIPVIYQNRDRPCSQGPTVTPSLTLRWDKHLRT